MQGLLLGLANGVTCLATCAPALAPLFLGEGRGVRRNWVLLGQFLAGRFLGYLLFGLLAWATGQWIVRDPLARGVIFGAAYVLLAAILLGYGIKAFWPARPTLHTGLDVRLAHWVNCPVSIKDARSWLRKVPALLPIGMGFFTGLNLCPPFLLAFASAAYAPSILESLLYFALFFVGTTVFFVPAPFLGALNRRTELQTVGKMAAVLVSFYYLYLGALEILAAFSHT